MPVWPCFSYPADQSPGSRNDDNAQAARRGLRGNAVSLLQLPEHVLQLPG